MGPLVLGSIPAAFPKPAVWVLMTSARSVTCPPFPPLRPKSLPPPPPPPPPPSTPSMPPCADVAVPGSCLRGERQACLMCDETESSEPLGDLGSREVVVVVVGGAGEGYREISAQRGKRWGQDREKRMLGYISLQLQSARSRGFGKSPHWWPESSGEHRWEGGKEK